MILRSLFAFLTAVFLAATVPAVAAPIEGKVRSSCGQESYSAGTAGQIEVLITGEICVGNAITTGTAGTPSSQVVTVQGITGGTPQPVAPNPYPDAATPITGNATGTTGSVVGTLAGTSSKTTYICGWDVSAIGGTAAVGPITVAGLTGSSMVYQGSSLAAGVIFSRTYTPCIPASATNTAITITTTADGTATAVDVNSWGFQK